jgi:hypothetical protein
MLSCRAIGHLFDRFQNLGISIQVQTCRGGGSEDHFRGGEGRKGNVAEKANCAHG